MTKYLTNFLASIFAVWTFVAVGEAADLCNQTSSKIRFTNHYTGAALLFGGVTTFTGWYYLNSGACKYIGANSGQKDILMVVQKEGRFWGWSTLVPSSYSVERRTVRTQNGDFWQLNPSQSFVCVPERQQFEDRRDWIPADRVASARCREGETLEKQLIYLRSFATGYLPDVSVILTGNGAVLR